MSCYSRNSSIRQLDIHRLQKGFGFAMRGVKGSVMLKVTLTWTLASLVFHPSVLVLAVNAGKFKPTPHVPSLQCIGYVENGGAADLAGLKQGDFIIEVKKR